MIDTSQAALQAATYKRQFSEANSRAKNLAFRLASTLAELDRMRDLLKPFAEAAASTDANDDYSSASIWEHPCALDITIGDLRRARRALALPLHEGSGE